MLATLPSRRDAAASAAPPVTGAYLSLTELRAAVCGRAERATARNVETKAQRVEATCLGRVGGLTQVEGAGFSAS